MVKIFNVRRFYTFPLLLTYATVMLILLQFKYPDSLPIALSHLEMHLNF